MILECSNPTCTASIEWDTPELTPADVADQLGWVSRWDWTVAHTATVCPRCAAVEP